MSAAIRDEVLDALRRSFQALGRKDIMHQCPSANDPQQVSLALFDLKRSGQAVRTDEGWLLAERSDAQEQDTSPEIGKEPANSAKISNDAAPSKPLYVADSRKRKIHTVTLPSESIEDEAPAPPTPNLSEYETALRATLRTNADNARYCLERYIEARGDRTLLALIHSVKSAEDALHIFNEGTHGG